MEEKEVFKQNLEERYALFGKNGYVEQLDASGIKAEIERENKVKISKYDGDFETKYMQEK